MAKLYFKYGAMGSSKTAQALITKFNYEERGMKVWLLKPSTDQRDGIHMLHSRIGLEAPAEVIAPEDDIYGALHPAGSPGRGHHRRVPVLYARSRSTSSAGWWTSGICPCSASACGRTS